MKKLWMLILSRVRRVSLTCEICNHSLAHHDELGRCSCFAFPRGRGAGLCACGWPLVERRIAGASR